MPLSSLVRSLFVKKLFQFFQVPRSYIKENDDLLDLSIAGHHLHGHEMKGPEFKKFLDQYPPWSYPVGWTASYKSYKF